MTRTVRLRLNPQQETVIDELRAHTGDDLDGLVARAVHHDVSRPPEPGFAGRRPAGRPPTPRAPGARVDERVEAGTGLGVALRSGETVRVEQVVDGCCADVNAFALDAPHQPFSAARTRAAHGLRPGVGAVLWSAAPEVDLLELVADTAGHHDLGYPACSAAEFAAITRQPDHGNCTELQRQVQEHWGVGPVHDPLNLWLPTGVREDGRLCWWPCRCRAGDHVVLRARRDVLVIVNPCASDLHGATQWELGPVRVIVDAPGPAPAAPTGPAPHWRWRDLPVREVTAAVGSADGVHVEAVRAAGWLGDDGAAVVRALVFRFWEDAVLGLRGEAR